VKDKILIGACAVLGVVVIAMGVKLMTIRRDRRAPLEPNAERPAPAPTDET
jgi:hypothetical protein